MATLELFASRLYSTVYRPSAPLFSMLYTITRGLMFSFNSPNTGIVRFTFCFHRNHS